MYHKFRVSLQGFLENRTSQKKVWQQRVAWPILKHCIPLYDPQNVLPGRACPPSKWVVSVCMFLSASQKKKGFLKTGQPCRFPYKATPILIHYIHQYVHHNIQVHTPQTPSRSSALRQERIFLDYADLEMRLGNIDRCRRGAKTRSFPRRFGYVSRENTHGEWLGEERGGGREPK